MTNASIIIPVFNGSDYLGETVRSAISQTYPAEVIVVDDGSTEDIPAVLAPFGRQVTYLHQDNRGLAAARNTGFRASTGKYILFLDSDDLLDATMLARSITCLEAEPEAGFVYCAWRQLSSDGKTFYEDVYPAYSGQILKSLLLRRFFFFASGTVIRRAVMEQIGLFDETLRWGEDADFWLRAAASGYTCAYLPESLLLYRIHPGSMTAQVSVEQVQGWKTVLEKFFASPDLTKEITAMQSTAYSVLHFETAGRFFRVGEIDSGRQQLAAAAQWDPRVQADWFLEWLAGTALDPRTEDPRLFIAAVIQGLPDELSHFRRLGRRALGRYHAAAAFSNFHSGRLSRARAHLWPAVTGDPSILRNPGFLSLIIKTLTGRGK